MICVLRASARSACGEYHSSPLGMGDTVPKIHSVLSPLRTCHSPGPALRPFTGTGAASTIGNGEFVVAGESGCAVLDSAIARPDAAITDNNNKHPMVRMRTPCF